jgi:hypothetical protein
MPNFSFEAFTSANTNPVAPAAPTMANTSSSTALAASIQPRKPIRNSPAIAAVMTTASIERRPCFSQ